MKKTLLAVALLSMHVVAAAEPPASWPVAYRANGNAETWSRGTGSVKSPTEATWSQAPSGNLFGTSSIAPKLGDGRAVPMVAVSLATGSALIASTATMLGTPMGMVLSAAAVMYLLAKNTPFMDWIMLDGGVNIRVKPDQTAIEKKTPSTFANYIYTPAAPIDLSWALAPCAATYGSACAQYNDPPGYPCAADVQMCVTIRKVGGNPGGYVYTSQASTGTKTCPVGFVPTNPVSASCVSDASWLPASMDDIAPYLTARPVPVALPAALLAAGVPIPVTPSSLTAGTPPADAAPTVTTTAYPKPADDTSTVIVVGNPFSLAANTPTVTATASTTRSVPKGSSSTTGPTDRPLPLPPLTLPLPATGTTTSTYNPATDRTTSNTITKTDAGSIVQTSAPVTNNVITNNTDSRVITTYNTTTIYNNTTTGAPLMPPTTDAETLPPPAVATDCELTPDLISCSKYGDLPAPDPLKKDPKPVVVTAVSFSSSSACPAPLSFSVRGASYGISYGPICDQLYLLKFLFLAMAAFIASYILADSFRV